MFGVQFYPTPENLVNKMLEKIDWRKVRFILEPSAGKGDICEGIRKYLKGSGKAVQLDCVEIDPNLRAILKEKHFNVMGNDFLMWDSCTRYDLIVMNPPFQNGDKHLLKALEMVKHGGQVVCILNAETVRKENGALRQDLMQRLEEYNADIEFISGAFSDAERKTDVEIALIYVKVPYEYERDFDLEGMCRAADIPFQEYDTEELVDADFFKAIVQHYKVEANIGLKIIDEYQSLKRYLKEDDIIRMSIATSMDVEKIGKHNAFLSELRYKYWARLFDSPEMRKLMTNDIREQYQSELNSFREYDFTLENVLQLKLEFSRNIIQGVEDAILKMFDKLTYQNSMDKSSNIHYYNGWKTNNACAIGKKSILGFWGLYDSRYGGCWWDYKATDTLEELEKVLTYLDNGRTDGHGCREIIHTHVNRDYRGERFSCKFFDLEFKKKGTVHIYYTAPELIKKMNIFAGKKKNWLPYDYGTKHYADMTLEEKCVANSFEGERSYEETHKAIDFYTMKPILMIAGA